LVDDYKLASVKSATVGGAPLGPAVIETVYKRLGFLIKMGYGLSETGSVTSTVLRPWKEASKYLQSTGTALEGTEIKVIATDGSRKGESAAIPGQSERANSCMSFAVLAREEVGELIIMSPSLMNGYLNNPVATAEAFDEDGWFRTGDIGKVDAEGNVYITDRLKEVIKVKGFQVAPAELEGYLNAHPEVADAGVVSVYSEDDATEYPFAYIVPMHEGLRAASQKTDEANPELIQYVARVLKFIESKVVEYKWIKGGVIVTDSIPKSNSGKLLRREFKQTIKGYPLQLYVPKKRATIAAKL
jgi:4-coumarate--CoA ligase